MSCSEWKETEVGKIPSHWEVITIDEIADVKGGKRLPKGESLQENKTPYPYIRLVDILNNRVDKTNIMYLTKDVQSKISRYIVEKDDICLAIVGNTIGLVFYITENEDKFNLTENAARITNLDTSKINSKFLFYYLNSKSGQHKIKSSQVGSAQGKLPIKNIKSISIPLPPLNEQEKIADVLSSLDNKIELNNEMNKTLEEMAKSIFKRWFVDFEFPNEDGQLYKSSGGEMVESELGMIPKGWEVKELGEISLLKYGKMPKKEDIVDCGNPIFSGYKITGYHREYMFKEPQLIVVARGVGGTGNVKFTPRNCFLTNLSIAVIFDNKNIEQYLYYYLKNANLRNLDTGSAQSQITIANLSKLKIILPRESILNRYHELTKNLLFNKESNQNENQCLIDLKALLLPKLMSGDIIF